MYLRVLITGLLSGLILIAPPSESAQLPKTSAWKCGPETTNHNRYLQLNNIFEDMERNLSAPFKQKKFNLTAVEKWINLADTIDRHVMFPLIHKYAAFMRDEIVCNEEFDVSGLCVNSIIQWFQQLKLRQTWAYESK